MAVSGKCYMSLHQMNSSANRGACNQICRRAYVVTDKDTGQELEVDNQYIMSPKDLKTIHFLNKMVDAGVRVFKIEGRARGPEYVKEVVECYNQALQAICDGTYDEEKIAQWDAKGQTGRSVRAMIVGIPNVGKSTFINRILGRKSAKAADKPGVTRGSQWFRVDTGIDLLDTPGILWPKFDDERTGILLACTGAVKDDILDIETLACKLMELLASFAPETICNRYKIAIPEEECDFLGFELLERAGRKRGFLISGGEIDTERMARILLDEFRGGVLGRITLESPEEYTDAAADS
jgi:ribosome biogenesis GTPase A